MCFETAVELVEQAVEHEDESLLWDTCGAIPLGYNWVREWSRREAVVKREKKAARRRGET